MNRVRGVAGALLVAAVALTTAGAAAGAVRIKQVDLASYPSVRVTVLTSKDTAAPTLKENGHAAPYLDASRLRAKSVVLAVDRSRSMNGGGLASATGAARKFVATKPPADRIALFSFASKPLQLTPFATDTIDVDSSLRSLSVDGGQGTRLYDSVVLASLALQHMPRAADPDSAHRRPRLLQPCLARRRDRLRQVGGSLGLLDRHGRFAADARPAPRAGARAPAGRTTRQGAPRRSSRAPTRGSPPSSGTRGRSST